MAPVAPVGQQNPGLTAGLLYWVTNGVLFPGYPAGGALPHPVICARAKPAAEDYMILADMQSKMTTDEIRLISLSLQASRPLSPSSATP
eukprot:1718063-Heterocapsa_arctica.AAC.1